MISIAAAAAMSEFLDHVRTHGIWRRAVTAGGLSLMRPAYQWFPSNRDPQLFPRWDTSLAGVPFVMLVNGSASRRSRGVGSWLGSGSNAGSLVRMAFHYQLTPA